jgi:hypothetical protein
MALVLKDRVKSNTTTTGTGTIVLGGAALGYQSFAAIGNANTTYYTIADSTAGDWEVGIGTYYSGNTSLVRNTVLSSSNSSALVNFAAGTKDVFVTQPAEVTAIGGGNQAIIINQNFENGILDSPNWDFFNIAWLQEGETPAKGRPFWNKYLLKNIAFKQIETDIEKLLEQSLYNLNAIKKRTIGKNSNNNFIGWEVLRVKFNRSRINAIP